MAEATYPEYDTHAAVRRLTNVGFTEPQAEAIVSEHVDHARQGLATKSDIQEVVRLVEASEERMKASEERLLARIEAGEERLLARIEASDQRMKASEERLLARIEASDQRVKASEARLRGEIKDAKVDFVKWGVPVIVSIVAVFAAIMKLF